MNYSVPPAKMPNQGNHESSSTNTEDVFGKPASRVQQIFESIAGMFAAKIKQKFITTSIHLYNNDFSEDIGRVDHDCYAENKAPYLVDLLMKFAKRVSIESDNIHLEYKSCAGLP